MGAGLWSRPTDHTTARRGLVSKWHPLLLLLVPTVAAAAVTLEHVNHPQWTSKYDKHFKKYAKHYFGPGTDWRWFKARTMIDAVTSTEATAN